MPALAAVATLGCLLSALFAVSPTAADASPQRAGAVRPRAAVVLSPVEARLLHLINDARAEAGVAPLRPAAGTTDVARRWSARLARQGALEHNPGLAAELRAAGSTGSRLLGEDVGVTADGAVDGLFATYLASPHHRAVLLAPSARWVGVGTAHDQTPHDQARTLWTTIDVVDTYDARYGGSRTRVPAAARA